MTYTQSYKSFIVWYVHVYIVFFLYSNSIINQSHHTIQSLTKMTACLDSWAREIQLNLFFFSYQIRLIVLHFLNNILVKISRYLFSFWIHLFFFIIQMSIHYVHVRSTDFISSSFVDSSVEVILRYFWSSLNKQSTESHHHSCQICDIFYESFSHFFKVTVFKLMFTIAADFKFSRQTL